MKNTASEASYDFYASVRESTSRFQKPSLALMNYVPIKNRILHSCNSLRMKSFDCVKVFREKNRQIGLIM